MANLAFTALVRKVVQDILPTYRLVETIGGSASQLVFHRPGAKECPHFRESVWFSKLRWGLPEFDVGIGLDYMGPAVGGAVRSYTAAPLGMGPVRRLLIDDQVAETLRRVLPDIDRHASEVFVRYRALYPNIDALGNELARLYITWRNALPPERKDGGAMMANAAELQGVDEETAALRQHRIFPYPAHALQERRRAHFQTWLTANGQLSSVDDPVGHWVSDFWQKGRPRTSEEFKIDKNLGDECSVCGAMRNRGRVVDKTDITFGPYAEFICNKCGTT